MCGFGESQGNARPSPLELRLGRVGNPAVTPWRLASYKPDPPGVAQARSLLEVEREAGHE